MTDTDRALWAAAQQDYQNALAIAMKSWSKEAPAEVVQAAAATVLIHITKLRGEERVHVRVPSAAVKGDVTQSAPSQASGDIPSCPQCGGEMYDNRAKKASGEFKPTSADFTCKDKSCKNEKGFRSGVWEKKQNPKGAKGNAHPVPAGGYDQPPPGLAPEDDDLPF